MPVFSFRILVFIFPNAAIFNSKFTIQNSQFKKPAYFVCPAGGVGRFEDDGHVVETAVVHKADKEVATQGSVAKCLMAVDMAAGTLLAVVEVYGTKVFEADDTLVFLHGELIAHLRAEVVAGSQRVAGVDTHTHAALVIDTLDNAGTVFSMTAVTPSV